MAEHVHVVDVKAFVDKLDDVYARLAQAQADLAKSRAERDSEHYAYLRADSEWRTVRLVFVLLVIALLVSCNEGLVRDLFRKRPTVDFAEHVSALVDSRSAETRDEHVRRIRDCMGILGRLLPATTHDTLPVQKQYKERGGDGRDNRITDADKAELNIKCSILTAR